jgi:hypothetical protein
MNAITKLNIEKLRALIKQANEMATAMRDFGPKAVRLEAAQASLALYDAACHMDAAEKALSEATAEAERLLSL